MDPRFEPSAEDSTRDVEVLLFASGVSILQVLEGEPETLDLTPYVTRCTQTQSDLSLSLAWHIELYGVAQPRPGQLVAVRQDGLLLCITIIETLADYREETGSRQMTLTCRSREATPAWRQVQRVTRDYPQGTRLDVMAIDVATSVGLSLGEVLIPILSNFTPHSSAQLAAMPAWSMLESLLLPAGYSPMMDSIGRLKVQSRDTTREADIVFTDDRRVVSINGQRTRSPITRLRLKWLDPAFTRVEQQDQILGSANITAGYFQIRQRQEINFSADQTQRARDTRLVVRQSANSGLLPLCNEGYEQHSDFHGEITLETFAFVPALLGTFLALKTAAALPDLAPAFGGPTITIGKQAWAAIELTVLLTMASIGTGSYEVWGIPFDFVKGRNTTEAYADGSEDEPWTESLAELESDFIQSADHAQAVAAREFIYQARAASNYNATLVDDMRLELGDIIQFRDGTRLYVTGYSRDLSHGAPALVDVQGFQV